MNFHVLSEAQGEVIAAAIWYDERQQGLGDQFLAEVNSVFESIKTAHAEFLTALEHYSGPNDIRRLLVKRFPYTVIIQCRPNETIVVAVAHARRRPFYWLERLN